MPFGFKAGTHFKIYFNATLLTPFAFNATPLFKSKPRPQTLSHTPAPANQTTTPLKFRAKFSATQSQCPNRHRAHLTPLAICATPLQNPSQFLTHSKIPPTTLLRARALRALRTKSPHPNRLTRTQNQPNLRQILKNLENLESTLHQKF